MAQQHQSPTQTTATEQSMQQEPMTQGQTAHGGQQSGATSGQPVRTGGRIGGQMTDQTTGMRLPQETRTALDSVAQAIQVCAWCADMCTQEADPMMIDCIKLCEDVTELGETVLALAPRNSYFTQDVVRTFQEAAQACARECGQHEHAHCQECATVLEQAAEATRQLAGTGTQQMQ